MLLTLNINSLRGLLAAKGSRKPKMDLLDVPRLASEELGLHGLTLTTEFLAGATRQRLEKLRDLGDKSGCACLVLIEAEALAMGDAKEDNARAGVERMLRVVEAASVLGCSAVAMSIKGKDDQATFDRAAERIKKVSERAERLEINVLVAPTDGLTADPERATALIKKVGGFRIGSMPDFQAAVASADPAAYLRRLTPFASAVNASTLEFVDPEPEARPVKKKPTKAKVDPELELDEEAEPADDAGPSGERALLAALEQMLDEDDEEELPPPPKHVPYDLNPLVAAIRAVGYDQTLSIDFRGTGDGTLGVAQSRDALEAALDALAH